MKTTFRPFLESPTFFSTKKNFSFREKEIILVDFKFYQKLLVILISFSTILIFPDSPRELVNICETYNTRELCNVW